MYLCSCPLAPSRYENFGNLATDQMKPPNFEPFSPLHLHQHSRECYFASSYVCWVGNGGAPAASGAAECGYYPPLSYFKASALMIWMRLARRTRVVRRYNPSPFSSPASLNFGLIDHLGGCTYPSQTGVSTTLCTLVM